MAYAPVPANSPLDDYIFNAKKKKAARPTNVGADSATADYTGMGKGAQAMDARSRADELRARIGSAQDALISAKRQGTIQFGGAEDLAARNEIGGLRREMNAYSAAARPVQTVFTPDQNYRNSLAVANQAAALTGRPVAMPSMPDSERASRAQQMIAERDRMRGATAYNEALRLGKGRVFNERLGDEASNDIMTQIAQQRALRGASFNQDMAEAAFKSKELAGRDPTIKGQMDQTKLRAANAEIDAMLAAGKITAQEAEMKRRMIDAQISGMTQKSEQDRRAFESAFPAVDAQNKYAAAHPGPSLIDQATAGLFAARAAKEQFGIGNPYSPDNITQANEQKSAAQQYFSADPQGNLVPLIQNDIQNIKQGFSVTPGRSGTYTGTSVWNTDNSPIAKSANAIADYVGRLEQLAQANPMAAAEQANQILQSMPAANENGQYVAGPMTVSMLTPAGTAFSAINAQSRNNVASTLNKARQRLLALVNKQSNQQPRITSINPADYVTRSGQGPY